MIILDLQASRIQGLCRNHRGWDFRASFQASEGQVLRIQRASFCSVSLGVRSCDKECCAATYHPLSKCALRSRIKLITFPLYRTSPPPLIMNPPQLTSWYNIGEGDICHYQGGEVHDEIIRGAGLGRLRARSLICPIHSLRNSCTLKEHGGDDRDRHHHRHHHHHQHHQHHHHGMVGCQHYDPLQLPQNTMARQNWGNKTTILVTPMWELF